MIALLAAGTMAAASSSGSVPSNLPTISSISDVIDPADALAGISFLNTGVISITSGGGSGGNWFSPTTSGIGASYWVKFIVSSGTVDVGVVSGTWYQLTFGKSISKSRTVVGSASASGTYFISTAGSDGTIVGDPDGGSWSLTATVDV